MVQGTWRRCARRIGRAGSMASIVLLLAVGSAAPAAPPFPAMPPTPCHAAELLLGAGLLTEASDAYHRVAARKRPRDPAALRKCVRRGFREIEQVRRQRAAAIARYGARERLSRRTIERLTTAVRIAPRPTDVARVMAAGIARRDGGHFGPGGYGVAIAATLHRARYDAEAQAVLFATLTRFPFVDIPNDLRGIGNAGIHLRAARALSRAGFDAAAVDELRKALIGDPTVAVPAELSQADHRTDWWNDWRGRVGPLVRSLAELALAVLIAVLALVLLLRILSRLRRNRVVIEDFKAEKEAFGKTTSASVRENYVRLRRDDGGFRLKLVSPGAEEFRGLPQGVTDVVPNARFVDAILTLLDRIMPTRTWRLTGDLQPTHPVRGAGLRLTLSRRLFGGFEEQTVWEKDLAFTPSRGDATQENYDRLAIPAAAWLIFATRTHPILRWRHTRVLGTDDWRSYALFAVGAELQQKLDPRPARSRYQRALGISPENYGARMQLAAVETQTNDPDSEAYREACESLAELCAVVTDPADPMWYRIRYNRVVALLPHADDEALRVVVELCEAILRYRDSRQPPLWPFGRGLRRYLKEVEPAALLLLASVLRECGCEPLTLRDPLPGDLTQTELRRRLRDARRSNEPTGLDHAAIAGYVLRRRQQLRADARYNLVRYCLRVGAEDDAKRELRILLDQGDPAIVRLAQDNADAEPRLERLLLAIAEESASPAEPDGDGAGGGVLVERVSVWIDGANAVR